MHQEITILSKLEKTSIIWYHLYVESKKKKKKDRNEFISKTERNS